MDATRRALSITRWRQTSAARLYEVRLPSGLRACSKIGRWGPMCSYLTERAVQIRTGQVGQPRGAARNDDEPRVLLLPDIEHISIHSCRINAWHLGSMLICQYTLWSNSSTLACQPAWEMAALLLATPSCLYPFFRCVQYTLRYSYCARHGHVQAGSQLRRGA